MSDTAPAWMLWLMIVLYWLEALLTVRWHRRFKDERRERLEFEDEIAARYRELAQGVPGECFGVTFENRVVILKVVSAMETTPETAEGER